MQTGLFFFFNGQISLLKEEGGTNGWFCFQSPKSAVFQPSDPNLLFPDGPKYETKYQRMALLVAVLSQASHVTLGESVKLLAKGDEKSLNGLNTCSEYFTGLLHSTQEILKVLLNHL